MFEKLLSRHGPLVDCSEAATLLGFNSRASLLRAINQERVALGLVRPEGRRKAFVTAKALAKCLAQVAYQAEEVTM